MSWRTHPHDPAQPPTPGVGDVAPDFRLRRTFDDSVSLGELTARGRVLLLFYVFDFGEV